MDALPSSKILRGKLRSRGRNYVEDLAWLRIGMLPAELLLVVGDGDAWRSQLHLLPLQPKNDKRAKGNTLN